MPAPATRETPPPMPAKNYGLIAMFDTPAEIFHAAEAVRDAGY